MLRIKLVGIAERAYLISSNLVRLASALDLCRIFISYHSHGTYVRRMILIRSSATIKTSVRISIMNQTPSGKPSMPI